MYSLCIKTFISIVIWLLYLEINPTITGIWIRPDSSGKNRICLLNILSFIKNTLSNPYFWSLSYCDINFIYHNIINISVLSLLEKFII